MKRRLPKNTSSSALTLKMRFSYAPSNLISLGLVSIEITKYRTTARLFILVKKMYKQLYKMNNPPESLEDHIDTHPFQLWEEWGASHQIQIHTALDTEFQG